MKIRMLALVGAAVLYAGAALADDPMANTYANTVTSRDKATGQSAALLFNQDMSYTVKGTAPNGQPFSYTGTWMLKDGGQTICLTPNAPAGMANPPKPSCSPLSAHNVGDTWTVTDDQNNTFDISIVAGR
jgi:hypothetical protein